MNLVKFTIIVSVTLLFFGIVADTYGQSDLYTPELAEDEVIICVNDPNTQENNSDINCHIYPIDNVDWYQETQENKYGQFGDYNDSFEMVLKH